MAKAKPIIAMSAPVAIEAAAADGDKPQPAKFVSTFYTGGAMPIEGWDQPVVIDLAGLKLGKVLVANLDHDPTKRVGNFVVANDGKTLVASGTATAATPARDEVVESAAAGYQWQSSLEVNPEKVESVKAGKTVEVNGQTLTGPLYVTRVGTLKGFAFVSHGADDNTTASIAASAAPTKEKIMKAEVLKWIKAMVPSIDVDSLSEEEVANIEANYEGRNGTKAVKGKANSPFEERRIEAKRRSDIREVADKFIERNPYDHEFITAVEKMYDHAIDAGMSLQDFRNEMYESSVPLAQTVPSVRARDPQINSRIVEAAICEAGRLPNIEKHYSDKELQVAHDRFKGRIGLNQAIMTCAESRGWRRGHDSEVTLECQQAAFGLNHPTRIHATGFSTLDIANILSNVANKFVARGFGMLDTACLRISRIKNVKDFKQTTTVGLTSSVRFEKLGGDGEIKHGTTGEVVYTNQADTYAKMLAITRKDLRNDDLGVLTDVPMHLGRGGNQSLNHIFWTVWLGAEGAGFFHSNNANINTGVADMTPGGLAATEAIFLNQTDYSGNSLGVQPAILVVPTALKSAAISLMSSERLIDGTATIAQGDANIWRGRFRVESSPYMSNSAYTGFSASEWYMIADPNEMAVIEIVAVDGRVEPTVETATADFHQLGIQMRAFHDVGVALMEKKAGVLADGGVS